MAGRALVVLASVCHALHDCDGALKQLADPSLSDEAGFVQAKLSATSSEEEVRRPHRYRRGPHSANGYYGDKNDKTEANSTVWRRPHRWSRWYTPTWWDDLPKKQPTPQNPPTSNSQRGNFIHYVGSCTQCNRIMCLNASEYHPFQTYYRISSNLSEWGCDKLGASPLLTLSEDGVDVFVVQRATLHYVSACGQCGSQVDLCSSNIWWQNEPDIEDQEEFRAGSDLATWGCANVGSSPTIVRNSITGAIYVVEWGAEDPWQLVFRQTAPFVFAKTPPQWTVNENDTTADNFAILGDLENFRVGGAFYFKLCWPIENLACQVWTQTTNPVTTTDGSVDGYAVINVSYTGRFWGGLHYNGNNALLDGSSRGNSNNWWYSIGAFNEYQGGFPGPDGNVVSQVELWVSTVELETAPLPDPIPLLPQPDANWQLLFRQTNSFFFIRNLLELNPGDPTAQNYAILDQLDNTYEVGGKFYFMMRWIKEDDGSQLDDQIWCQSSGKFYFMMRWIKEDDGSQLDDQIWCQSSNPVTTTDGTVTGYEAIDVPYTGRFWGGLHYNGNNALLDGSSRGNSNNWWYSIGAFNEYLGGFPGPDGIIASQVELWVSNESLAIPTPPSPPPAISPVPPVASAAPSATWTLLFRQTNNFFFHPGLLSLNDNDDSADNYAILDQLDNTYEVGGKFYFMMRWIKEDDGSQLDDQIWCQSSGKFYFMMRWIKEDDGSQLDDQIWCQSSNPVTTTDGTVTGYQAIVVPYTGQLWGGLHYNGNNALLDGSSVSNSNNWWYSIGAFNEYLGGFPGPNGIVARVCIDSHRSRLQPVKDVLVARQHIRTGMYMGVRAKASAQEQATSRRVELQDGTMASWLTVNPFFSHRTQGELVSFNEMARSQVIQNSSSALRTCRVRGLFGKSHENSIQEHRASKLGKNKRRIHVSQKEYAFPPPSPLVHDMYLHLPSSATSGSQHGFETVQGCDSHVPAPSSGAAMAAILAAHQLVPTLPRPPSRSHYALPVGPAPPCRRQVLSASAAFLVAGLGFRRRLGATSILRSTEAASPQRKGRQVVPLGPWLQRFFSLRNRQFWNYSVSPRNYFFARRWCAEDSRQAIFVAIVHLGALAAPFFFTWKAFACFCVGYVMTGMLGVTLSYHRQLSHRSFVTPKWLEYFLAYCGALAVQGPPISWVSSHRHHHGNTDAEDDVHSPRDGFWWSHMGFVVAVVLPVPSEDLWYTLCGAAHLGPLRIRRFALRSVGLFRTCGVVLAHHLGCKFCKPRLGISRLEDRRSLDEQLAYRDPGLRRGLAQQSPRL
eukprot:s3223_g9.t2